MDNKIESERVFKTFTVERVLRRESTLQLQFTASRFALTILFHVSSRTGTEVAAGGNGGTRNFLMELVRPRHNVGHHLRLYLFAAGMRVGFRHCQKDAVKTVAGTRPLFAYENLIARCGEVRAIRQATAAELFVDSRVSHRTRSY